MGDDVKELYRKQGMPESKLDDFVKTFDLCCGKNNFKSLLIKCGLKNRSNKSWAPEYYTNRVIINSASDV